jgi:hypothetical protein
MPDTAGPERLAHPAVADGRGSLPGRPMPHGPASIRRRFPRDRAHLAHLCRRHAPRRERLSRAPSGCTLLPFGGQSQPALAPEGSRPAREAPLARPVALGGSRLQRSTTLGAPSQPRGTRRPARPLLPAGPLSCRQRPPGGDRGGWRHGGGPRKLLAGALASCELLGHHATICTDTAAKHH